MPAVAEASMHAPLHLSSQLGALRVISAGNVDRKVRWLEQVRAVFNMLRIGTPRARTLPGNVWELWRFDIVQGTVVFDPTYWASGESRCE